MIERRLSLPTIDLIAGTRAAFGIGIGLLLAERFTKEHRRAYGWTLVAERTYDDPVGLGSLAGEFRERC